MKKIYLILLLIGCLQSVLCQESVDNVYELKKELLQELSDSSRVTLNLKIGKYYSKSKNDSSLFYLKNALKLANKIESSVQLPEILRAMASHYDANNDYDLAIKRYTEAAAFYKSIGNTKKEALMYNNIGYNYFNLYAEDRASEYYLKSLSLYKSISDEKGEAVNMLDIGNLYYDQENYDYAKKYFNNALDIYEILNDSLGIASCYTNIGNATADAGSFTEGLEFFKKSIEMGEPLDDQIGIAINYNNIGDCYIQLSDYKNADVYFLKSLKIATEVDDQELISIVFLNIADVANKLHNYEKAILNAKKGLKIANQIGKIDLEVDNLTQLVDAHEGLGNKMKELFYLKEQQKLKDSLIKNDKNKKVQLFEALNKLENTQYTIDELSNKNELAELRYKTEKEISFVLIMAIVIISILMIFLILQQGAKKKAYNLLEFKNHQISRMNDEIQIQSDNLKRLNKTKDKFFSIIAHDLKNPFNSIKGFTELMIENIENYDKDKKLKFLKIIKGSTIKASDLLSNLLIWANTQSGDLKFHPQKIELVNQVSNVVSLLEIQAVNKEIKIVNHVKLNVFVRADENMLDTILRNLISNAIKFTHQLGEVQIDSQVKDDFVEITVKDNGIGLSETDIKDLFNINVKNSNLGTANEQGSGLGLILCHDFVKKNGGNIWAESVLGKGSSFKFTLPIWQE